MAVTLDCYVYFPAALLAASTSTTTDFVWMGTTGDGSDPSVETLGANEGQAVFLAKVSGVWKWTTEWGFLSPAGTVVADTWYHVELDVTRHAPVGPNTPTDYELIVDGVSTLMETSSPFGNTAGDITHVTLGSDATGDAAGVLYFDQASVNGVAIDNFEGGLGAWDFVVGSAATSTDVAHSGTHSLKIDDSGGASYVTIAATDPGGGGATVESGVLAVAGSAVVTVLASVRLVSSGLLSVSATGDVEAIAIMLRVPGALAVSGSGSVQISVSQRLVMSGLVAVSGSADVSVDTLHFSIAGLLTVSGSGAITLTKDLAGPLSVSGSGAITLTQGLAGALSVSGANAIAISGSLHVGVIGPVAVAGQGAITILDVHLTRLAGPLSVSRSPDVEVDGQVRLRIAPPALGGKPAVDATYIRNFSQYRRRA